MSDIAYVFPIPPSSRQWAIEARRRPSDFRCQSLCLFFSSIDGDKACWNSIRCTEYNSMLSKQYGSIIIFLVGPSWWSSYMFEYYEVRFKFTTFPLHLHCGSYVIQHCRPQNRWQLWVLEIYGAKKDEGAVLPQVGRRLSHTLGWDVFFGALQIMHISFLYFIFSLKKLLTLW